MLVVFALVLARVLGLFAGAPLFSRRSLPPRVMAILSVGIAASLLEVAAARPAPEGAGATMLALASEFGIGMTIGLLARFLLVAFELAGAVVSFQMGFAVANAFDPDTGRSTPIISTLHLQLATVIFLVLDGHHLLLRSLAASYETFPLGGAFQADLIGATLLDGTRTLYELGARIAAPVSGLMLLINATIGFLNRVVPQLSIFSVGFPLTVLSGLIAVALSVPELAAFFLRAYAVFEVQLQNFLLG